ncbi:hypothetical protein [Xenorhabdus szentirmaii]|uniref:hypothetical protein n=2 Tax=Xenorhabdus szentirmaii TaxID=290112 RepID=UPI0019CE269A|nr:MULTISPECIES: hypothetical protein [unclassified Xenorhabdus]MBD2791729.1 hypothetical protein [Xenorhabdus sp. CUL]MBD2804089.1 hypothetical protein [Xenorhabdus sp. ZM]
MRIADYHCKLPKLYRVVEVELDVLRDRIYGCGGVMPDCDEVKKRQVRRVKYSGGWKWQLVRKCRNQEVWDYYFEQDRACLENLNYDLGLI